MTHNVETINIALREIAVSEEKFAESLVMVHLLPMWEVLHEETGGAWPERSLTIKMIDNSQRLQDLFVLLTQQQRSEFIYECKFVKDNYEAVVSEAMENGWRKLPALRKALQRAEKKKAKETEEVTKDTEEVTKETEEVNEEIGLDAYKTEDDIIRFYAVISIKAKELGVDPVACFRKSQKEIADPNPLEIPEAFRR